MCQRAHIRAARLHALLRVQHLPQGASRALPHRVQYQSRIALPPPPPDRQTPKFRFVSSRKGVTSARRNGAARTFHFTPPFLLAAVNAASALFPQRINVSYGRSQRA